MLGNNTVELIALGVSALNVLLHLSIKSAILSLELRMTNKMYAIVTGKTPELSE